METALTTGWAEQTLLPTSICPSADPNERRLKGAIQSPAPSESKLLESGRVYGYNSHLCFESTHGKGSLMKFDILLLAPWVLSAAREMASRWRHWNIALVLNIGWSGFRKALWLCVHSKQTFVIDQQQPTSLHNTRYWVSAFSQSWLHWTESLKSHNSNYI